MPYNREFLQNMRDVTKLYDRMCREVCDECGMTRNEIDVLAFLVNNADMDAASDIVRLRMLPKANVSQGVDLLIRKGYVERKPDAADRRKVHLSVTEASERAAERIREIQELFAEQLCDGFTEEERSMFTQLCRRMAQNARIHAGRGKNGENI